MKRILLLLVILPALAFGQAGPPVNSFKELDKTMAVFLECILVRKQDPNALFLLKKEEMARITEGKRTDREVEQRYAEYVKNDKSSFAKFALKQGYRSMQITDTLTFQPKEWNSAYRALTVFIHFTDDTTHYAYPQSYKEQFVEVNFALIYDELRLLDYSVKSSKPDVTNRRRDYAESAARGRITDPRFMRFGFGYEEQPFRADAIPFRKKGKWGFMSADNTVLFPAICDSLFPSASGYTRIVVNGRYNLIGPDFKRVFEKEVKSILPGPFYFTSPGSEELQPRDFFTKYKETVQLPAVYTFADSIRRIKTAYIYSNDGTQFRSLKPYLEVAEMIREKPEPGEVIKGKGSRSSAPFIAGDQDGPQIMVDEPVQTSLFREVPEPGPAEKAVPEPNYVLLTGYSAARKKMYRTLIGKAGDTIADFTEWEHLLLAEDLLIGKRNDTTYIMEPGGKVLFRTYLYCCSLDDKSVVKIFDASTGLLGAYCLKTRKAVAVQYRSIQLFPGMLKVITQDYRYGFVDENGRELFD